MTVFTHGPLELRERHGASTALVGAFRRHRIVALGLSHGLRQQEDFVIGLLRHPRFAATVDSIVVEFGNARFQVLADRYVAGGDVPAKALRPVWRETIGTAPDAGPDEAPAQSFAAVRRLKPDARLAPRLFGGYNALRILERGARAAWVVLSCRGGGARGRPMSSAATSPLGRRSPSARSREHWTRT